MGRGVRERVCAHVCAIIFILLSLLHFVLAFDLLSSLLDLLSPSRVWRLSKLSIAESSQIIILLTFIPYYTYVFCTIFTKIVITSVVVIAVVFTVDYILSQYGAIFPPLFSVIEEERFFFITTLHASHIYRSWLLKTAHTCRCWDRKKQRRVATDTKGKVKKPKRPLILECVYVCMRSLVFALALGTNKPIYFCR